MCAMLPITPTQHPESPRFRITCMQALPEIGVDVPPSAWPQPQPPPPLRRLNRSALSELTPSLALPPNLTLVPPISVHGEHLAFPPPSSPPIPPTDATMEVRVPIIAAVCAVGLLALVGMAVGLRVWARHVPRPARRGPARRVCPYSEADHDATDQDLFSQPVRARRSMPVSAMNPAYEYVLPPHLALVSPQTATPTEAAEMLHTYPAPHCSSRRFCPADCGGAGQALTSSPRTRRLPENLDAMLPLPPAASAASASASAGAFHTESASAVSLSGMVSLYAAAGTPGIHTAPMRQVPSLPQIPSLAAQSYELVPEGTVNAAPYPAYTPTSGSFRATATFQPTTGDMALAADGEGGAMSSLVSPTVDVLAAGTGAEQASQETTEVDRSVGSGAGPATASAAEDGSCSRDQFRRLERQLDSFGVEDEFLGRFLMLGRNHQRRGGELLAADCDCCAVLWPSVRRVAVSRSRLVTEQRVCSLGCSVQGFSAS